MPNSMNTNLRLYLTNTNLLLLLNILLLIILILLIYQLNQIKNIFKEKKIERKAQDILYLKPKIFVYLDLVSSGRFEIIIQNFGNSIANNVRIIADNKLIEKCDESLKLLFKELSEGRLNLNPNQTYSIELKNPELLWNEVFEINYEYTYYDINKEGLNQLQEAKGCVDLDFTLYKEKYKSMHELKVINIEQKK